MYKNIYINDSSSYNKNKKPYSRILKLNSTQSNTNIQKKIQSAKQQNLINTNIGIKINSGRRIRSAKKYSSGKRIRSGKRHKIEIGKNMLKNNITKSQPRDLSNKIKKNTNNNNKKFNRTENYINQDLDKFSKNPINNHKPNLDKFSKNPINNHKPNLDKFIKNPINNHKPNLDKFSKIQNNHKPNLDKFSKIQNNQNLDKFIKKTRVHKNPSSIKNNKLNNFFTSKNYSNNFRKKKTNIVKIFKNHPLQNDEINIKLKMNKKSLEKLSKLNFDNFDLQAANEYLCNKGIIKSNKTPEFLIKYLYKEHGDNFIKF